MYNIAVESAKKEDVLAARKIIVASSKGGVGKSTVALGVAGALNSLGKTVLICDLDFENRCLDLFMGVESTALFNVADIAAGRVNPGRAILKNSSGLSFLAAPEGASFEEEGGTDKEGLAAALKKVVDYTKADFVIFDTGTAHGIPALVAKTFPDARALIVASHQATATRGAERMAEVLEAAGVKECKLVICGYEFKAATGNERSGLIEIIDSSRVPLIGVVPYDRALMLSHERGVRAPEDSPSSIAFENIAERLLGETVRLFDGIGSVNRKKII